MTLTTRLPLALLICLLTAAAPGGWTARPIQAAGTWYVAPGGSDSNPCASAAAPCATVQAAIDKAAGGDSLRLAAGTYTGTGVQVVLLNKSLNLLGGWNAGFTLQDGLSTLDGGGVRRVIHIPEGVTTSLERLIIQNGYNPVNENVAGGIHNEGTLTLSDSIVDRNMAYSGSGGLTNFGGTATLSRTVVTNNGGGLLNSISYTGGGSLTLNASTIAYNAGFYGGLYNGPWLGSSVYINNSAIFENWSNVHAGGLTNAASSIVIHSSSIVNNKSELTAGGVQNLGETVVIANSLLDSNRSYDAAADCSGMITSQGYSLIGTLAGCGATASGGDLFGVASYFVLLNDMVMLPASSPAVDGGDPAGCLDHAGAPILTDQRLTARPLDGDGDGSAVCDIGAYESDPANPLRQSFLAFLGKPRPGISGRVTLGGAAAPGVTLELRHFNGSAWSTALSTVTEADGGYAFVGAGDLGPGQLYYVRYLNTTGAPGVIWFWGTRQLTAYAAGSAVKIGDFDISDIDLTVPPAGASVPLPVTFEWTPRPAAPSDSYEFNLYDPTDFAPYVYTNPPLGYVGAFTLGSLPPDFATGTQYAWDVWAYSPDGGTGISYETRYVTFTTTGYGLPAAVRLTRSARASADMDLPTR